MSFASISTQVFVLFILLGIGYILRRKNILKNEASSVLSDLIIYATLPSLIITSMNYEFSQDKFQNSIQLILIGLLVFFFLAGVGYIFVKLFHTHEPQRGVYRFLITFANVGFMGYPVVEIVYGELGVFYAAIYNIWFNIFLWTIGVLYVNHEEDKKFDYKSLLNPGIISIIIGFIFFIFSIKIPAPIFMALDSLGDSTIPLAMIVVGLLFADADAKQVFKNKRLLLASLVKLIIIPFTLLGVLMLIDLPPIVLGIPVIISAMPSAANAAIFARKYNSDYRLASQGVFLTTLLSIGTIPLIILIMTKI